MYLYRAYGLTLASNRALPGLLTAPASGSLNGPDVALEFAGHWPTGAMVAEAAGWVELPGPISQDTESFSWSTLAASGGRYHRLRYGAVGESIDYLINPGASQVWIAHQKPEWYDGAASLMLGQVMGCVLRLRGLTCLHASVVAVGDRAVAVLGAARAGKSTFAAAAAQRGLAVLADDIAVISEAAGGAILAQPGYPHLRLSPAAISAFYGTDTGLRPVFSFLDKRYVDLNPQAASAWHFQAEALPLVAMYVLGPRHAELAEVVVRPLTPAAGLLALKANSYVHFVLDQLMQAREFGVLGRLARQLPIRLVERPDGLDYLPALCEAVVQDAAAAARSAPALPARVTPA